MTGFLDVLQERGEKPSTVFRVLIPLTKILNIRSLISKFSIIEDCSDCVSNFKKNLNSVGQEIVDDDKETRVKMKLREHLHHRFLNQSFLLLILFQVQRSSVVRDSRFDFSSNERIVQ